MTATGLQFIICSRGKCKSMRERLGVQHRDENADGVSLSESVRKTRKGYHNVDTATQSQSADGSHG